jgi:putative phage-type endonuclease
MLFKNKTIETFYNDHVATTKTDLSMATTDQAASPLWRQERKYRISASQAHRIAHAKTVEKSLEYFLDDGKNIEHLAPVQYGRETEPIAKQEYEKRTGRKIEPSGLVVSAENPWICASPDGIVERRNGEKMVLEIKCPFSCRDKPLIDVPYLDINGLKKNHAYFTQVQLQMYCCELKTAHFFVYGGNGNWNLSTVERDDVFLKGLIGRLEKLYFETLLPELVSRRTSPEQGTEEFAMKREREIDETDAETEPEEKKKKE